MAHDYLENLEALAEAGREIIFYDQLGCGKSSVPKGAVEWSTDIWEKEIDVVRQELELEQVHILGQSWGGMLAMQYAIHNPKGVNGLILSSSPASMKLWQTEAHRLINLLPKEEKQAIVEAEKTGDYKGEMYKNALEVYYTRHVNSITPKPEELKRSDEQVGEVYEQMIGPSEFTIVGKLKSWDVTQDLSQIKNRTLLISGTDDEATPLIEKTIYDQIPRCEWSLLPGTHMIHIEQKEEYQRIVNAFLERIEKELD